MWVLVCIPAALLPFLCPGKGAENGSKAFGPCTHVGDLEVAPGSWILASDGLSIGEVNSRRNIFLSHLLSVQSDFPIQINKSILKKKTLSRRIYFTDTYSKLIFPVSQIFNFFFKVFFRHVKTDKSRDTMEVSIQLLLVNVYIFSLFMANQCCWEIGKKYYFQISDNAYTDKHPSLRTSDT